MGLISEPPGGFSAWKYRRLWEGPGTGPERAYPQVLEVPLSQGPAKGGARPVRGLLQQGGPDQAQPVCGKEVATCGTWPKEPEKPCYL